MSTQSSSSPSPSSSSSSCCIYHTACMSKIINPEPPITDNEVLNSTCEYSYQSPSHIKRQSLTLKYILKYTLNHTAKHTTKHTASHITKHASQTIPARRLQAQSINVKVYTLHVGSFAGLLALALGYEWYEWYEYRVRIRWGGHGGVRAWGAWGVWFLVG